MTAESHSLEETLKRKDKERPAADVAAELVRLAEQINRGHVTVSGEAVPVGDSFSCRVKKQIKKGVFSCEIILHARATATAAMTDSTPVAQELPRPIVPKKSAPPGGKKLKKEISRLWKRVAAQVEKGTGPATADGADLLRACEEYTMYADKEWFDSWRHCHEEIRACLALAGRGDYPAAQVKMATVNRLTKECHSLYK
ncbi:MAG: hypothetical protein ACOY32_10890 [Thermodesulfobacteriota bacterium]